MLKIFKLLTNKSNFLALPVCILVLGLGLTNCSPNSHSTETTTLPKGYIAPATWASSICDIFIANEAKLDTLSAAFLASVHNSASLNTAQVTLLNYINEVSSTISALESQVVSTPIPNDPKGKLTREKMITVVQSFAQVMINAKSQAQALSVTDINAFRVGAAAIGTTVQIAAQSTSKEISFLESKKGSSVGISNAFLTSNSCKTNPTTSLGS